MPLRLSRCEALDGHGLSPVTKEPFLFHIPTDAAMRRSLTCLALWQEGDLLLPSGAEGAAPPSALLSLPEEAGCKLGRMPTE